MDTNAIRTATEAAGLEMAYSEESFGDSRSFELLIFVRMSERRLDHDLDSETLYKAADLIKRGLHTVSAQLDPKGAEMREAYRKEIADIYEVAGVGAIYMEALPNSYCSEPCCLNKPWFRVTSKIGHVVIGWRKSVMSIDWKDSTIKQSGEALFPGENVTRWETGIHAWDVEKAAEYIRRLHNE